MLQFAAGIAVLFLGACAGMRMPPLLAPEVQEAFLRDLPAFSLRGRAVVVSARDRFSSSLSWTQDEEETELRLFVIGGSLKATWRPGLLKLESSKGQRLEGAEAEQALVDELGFLPPFESLRYWVLGLEAPGEPAVERTPSESGRIGVLRQQQWRIVYGEWRNVKVRGGAVAVPGRLTVSRDDLRLTVALRKWEL